MKVNYVRKSKKKKQRKKLQNYNQKEAVNSEEFTAFHFIIGRFQIRWIEFQELRLPPEREPSMMR